MHTLISELNKILTNTLGYKETLEKLSGSVSDESTRKKLREMAEVKEEESQNLMKLISGCGGDVESTERTTDQKKVAWISEPLPDDDMDSILDALIKAEQKAVEDYDTVLDHDKLEELGNEKRQVLEKHRQEASANLEYFMSAKSTRSSPSER